ncbi:MAG: pantetheine-phosphate adenylyltransferase [Candidatus Cloacimonetes bacterium]|jgi:pantetheine-phosphate adenylyltransferase|nr:pantetheine-phosphate adenylyltransferase [Candidatus Cloacimonadota bacterium]
MTERKRVAIYPGSFDPVTRGHEDIVRRALGFCDVIIVAVAHRRTQRKDGLFTIEERLELLREVFRDEPRIRTAEFEGLLVDFARENGASLLVRGLRAVSDFEYEFQMASMNRHLWPEVETVFLTPDEHFSYLSASLVREIASLGGDVASFVSPPVLTALHQKFGRE